MTTRRLEMAAKRIPETSKAYNNIGQPVHNIQNKLWASNYIYSTENALNISELRHQGMEP
jgi:hypothetical protein